MGNCIVLSLTLKALNWFVVVGPESWHFYLIMASVFPVFSIIVCAHYVCNYIIYVHIYVHIYMHFERKECRDFKILTFLSQTIGSSTWSSKISVSVKDENIAGHMHLIILCSGWLKLYIKSESEVSQSCPTLCNPVDCSLPGSSAYWILQARILEWVAVFFSRGSSKPRDQTQVSHIAGRCFNLWVTREAPCFKSKT